MSWTIYRIYNKVTGKSYIGQTKKSPIVRFKEHLAESRKNSSNNYFKNALSKYPKEVWEIKTLLKNIESRDEADRYEILWISKLGTQNNGYNSTSGGEGVRDYIYTEETKRKLSEERRRRKGNKTYSFYNPEHGILEESIHIMDISKKYGILPGNFWYLVQGKTAQVKGWYLYKGEEAVYTNRKLYTLYHPDHGEVTCTNDEFEQKYKVNGRCLRKVATGDRKSYKGWTLPGVTLPPSSRIEVVKMKDGNVVKIYRSIREAAKELSIDTKTMKKLCTSLKDYKDGFTYSYRKQAEVLR